MDDHLKIDSWENRTFTFFGDIKFTKTSKELILKKNLGVDNDVERQVTKLLKYKRILFECLEYKSQETYKDKFKENLKQKIVKKINDVSDQYQITYDKLKGIK